MKDKLLEIIDLSKTVPKSDAEKRSERGKKKKSSIWNKGKNDKKIILENVNLEIYEKTTLGLIGPTGSGKTSILRLINMLDEASSGKILYKGETLSKKNLKLRRNIAMVFQKPIVFKGTVFDNIYYGLKVRDNGKEECEKDILYMLKKVGLEGYEHQKASTLSGGEIQRVALARALIIKPKILLLDEPTANLDPTSTEKIEAIIDDIQKNGDISIVMATHNLIQGQKLCDEIAIVNRGILQFGKTEEIFSKPKNKFVAEFVGMKNVEKGIITKNENNVYFINVDGLSIISSREIETCRKIESKDVYIGIKPEDISISKSKIENDDSINQFKGKVINYKDNGTFLEIKIDVGKIFLVYLTRKAFLDLKIDVESEVWIQFKTESVHLFTD